ncbi:hypothetical protein [Sodalis phage phiSG1]|uniref:hypothetical protein n=1 Tax=Sodalis phage phiSG1 TaxID=373126 RepID=UPI00006C5BF2|nr:hypothetical protein SGPHI_0009 [Sodalis phage phiSG1]BAE80472.1 hypothetical protein [Sodalis phage phiSG1]
MISLRGGFVARKSEFTKTLLQSIEGYVRHTGDRTDSGIAKHICKDRRTVAEWRSKYPELEKSINTPNIRIGGMVDRGIEKLVTKGRVEVIYDGKGNIKEKRVLEPTPQDFNVALKAGFGGTERFKSREELRLARTVIRDIRKRLFAEDITYSEAASECEEEGFDIPESWKRREIARIIKLKTACELTALEAAQLLESEGIAVPKTLMLEVQKAIGGVSEEFLMSDEELDRRIREFNNGSSE